MRAARGEQGGTGLDARRMSYSIGASRHFAANNHRRSSRKANTNHVLGSAAVTCLVLGCAWNLYTHVFGASIYPTIAGGNFDAPVMRRPQPSAARDPQTIVNNVFAALPEPMPVISAPVTAAAISSLDFSDRFGAAAPQGVAPTPQAETPKLAEAAKPIEPAKF